MQIKNKLHVKRYVFGTIFNLSWSITVFGLVSTPLILTFMFCILLNQYFLAIVVSDLTRIDVNTSILPTWLCGALKLVVLVMGFFVAMKYTVNMEHFLVLIYIFQLIILVISTKRVVKKN
jgi:hypothetical protein